jgi:hypothetical protein
MTTTSERRLKEEKKERKKAQDKSELTTVGSIFLSQFAFSFSSVMCE